MELCKDGGNMITWFGARDETSSGILYSLQWLKGRLRKSREHSIAVVEATQYQRGDEPLRNLIFLHYICNLSFTTGCVSNSLKVAKVVPIFKKGDTINPSNYRPISLLSVFL